MSGLSILVICFASVTLYVGIYHLLSYFRMRDRRENLAFALMCFTVVFYDFFSAALYDAGSVARGAVWQKWQAIALCGMGIFLLKFVSEFTRRKSRLWDYVFSLYWMVNVLILWLDRSYMEWSGQGSVKDVKLFKGFSVTYYEVEPGLLMKILSATAVIAIVYILASLVPHCSKKKRQLGAVPVLAGVTCLGLGILNDAAVSMGLYKFVYLIEFSHMGLVLCMAYSLTEVEVFLHKALRESNDKCRNLLESANDAIFIIDIQTGTILDANKKAEDLIGLPRSRLAGMHHTMIHPQDEKDTYEKIFKNQVKMKGGCIFDGVYAAHRDGRKIPVEISASIIEMGRYTVMQGIFRDISQRRQIEEELLKLAAAVNAADESIVMTDADGIIKYVNPCFEHMTGFTRYEVIGKSPGIVKSGRHDKDFYAGMWATISSGKTWRGHFINKKKDGTLFEEEAVISPVCSANGKVVNYVAVKRDVTRQVALENQLRQSQKMEALGRLAGKVAHDFTNMLVIMFAHAQMLKGRLQQIPDGLAQLDEMMGAVNRASKLTSELLAFAHNQDVVLKAVDLNKAVQGVRELLNRTVGVDIAIKMHIPDGPLKVRADLSLIEQIIVHLVVNACDAMPNGGCLTISNSSVHLSADEVAQLKTQAKGEEIKEGGFGVLSVSDDGVGMTHDVQAMLFEPFFTTKRERHGTGLGLSTTYGIVRQHGGFIAVYSKPGSGSTFDVYIPLLREEDVAHNGVHDLLPSGTETVLFVAEDSIIRMVGVKILRELGYTVLEATNSEGALKLSGEYKHPIHVLLADLFMSDKAGKDLAKKMKEQRPEIKAVFMSGYPKVHLVERAVIGPDDVVICRPVNRHKLAYAIRDVLKA